MKLEDQVCSLELAKRLKELGVKQESAFYFETIVNEEGDKSVINLRFGKFYDDAANERHVTYISAFTVAELGEMLPDVITYGGHKRVLVMGRPLGEFEVSYRNSMAVSVLKFKDDTEANTRAKCLIYLIEQGIIKL